ncbi:MAG TPA: DUF2089 domain-containing protein [Chloroflexota bacterium]
MNEEPMATVPSHCPVCDSTLVVTQLQCPACSTDVSGVFSLSRLASLREPHASLLELFLRKRGNVKEMERELGLSYPTIRARLDEAFTAAGLEREPDRAAEADAASRRTAILDELERGEISATEAASRLRELKTRRNL